VTEDILENAQRQFWALDVTRAPDFFEPDSNLAQRDLQAAETDGMLWPVGSTYSHENDTVVDGLSRPGTRLVTFAPLLKGQVAPFAEIIQLLLDMAERGLSGPAEIEFALNLEPEGGGLKEFAFLQIRPIAAVDTGLDAPHLDYEESDLLVRSADALGNGRIADVHDLVVVRPENFARERTVEIAGDVGRMNDRLRAEGRHCILIGPGRWGTADRWLGIPVQWAQISQARAIVECDLEDLVVEPSQGTHFFQNMTSYGIAYLHVYARTQGFLDRKWLDSLPSEEETRWVRLIRLEEPLEILVDGKKKEGVILKRPWSAAEAPG
jgi:hypothetical protein